MKGFIEVNRLSEDEVKTGFFTTTWKTTNIKIAIKVDDICAFVDYRVYLKNKSSFSCDETYEEIKQKIKEAQGEK